MKQKSIYEIISENEENGKLKDDFSLPSDDDKETLQFADGAMDGMSIYHIAPYQADEEDFKLIETAVNMASAGNTKEAETTFAKLGKKARAVQLVDIFQQYIIDHSKTLNVNNLFECAMELILHSSEKESIKFALEILELINTDRETVKKYIRTIGLSDEFTIFAIWIMQTWENGNKEIFKLAQKVNGWGKIHAVEALNPETEEIKNWILMHGTQNYVVNAYSALTCWKKSQAEERLKGKISFEEFEGILTIVDALLDEGPTTGISAIKNSDEIISDIISRSESFDLTIEDYETILNIEYWAENEREKKPLTIMACNKALSDEKCQFAVKNAVKDGKGIRLAEKLGIDYKENLLNCLNNDFENNFCQCNYLIEDEKYIEKTLEIFRNKLPFDEMLGEPENKDVGYAENFKNSTAFQVIVQNLRNKPLIGKDLIIKGLKCKNIRCRRSALTTIQHWVKLKNVPVSQLSTEIYNEIIALSKKESDEVTKKIAEDLLENK